MRVSRAGSSPTSVGSTCRASAAIRAPYPPVSKRGRGGATTPPASRELVAPRSVHGRAPVHGFVLLGLLDKLLDATSTVQHALRRQDHAPRTSRHEVPT